MNLDPDLQTQSQPVDLLQQDVDIDILNVTQKYICPYCLKNYSNKNAFTKHEIYCKFSCGASLNKTQEEVEPTHAELVTMVRMLIDDSKKTHEQITQMSKFLNYKKNKINIVNWLNLHKIPEAEYKDLCESIKQTPKDIELILNQNKTVREYTMKIYMDTFTNYTANNRILPIYCCIQSPSIFYIYTHADKWHKCEFLDLTLLYTPIMRHLITGLKDWEKKNASICRKNPKLLELITKTWIKIWAVEMQPQNQDFLKIRQLLFNHLKDDLKTQIEFEFEFN